MAEAKQPTKVGFFDFYCPEKAPNVPNRTWLFASNLPRVIYCRKVSSPKNQPQQAHLDGLWYFSSNLVESNIKNLENLTQCTSSQYP